MSVAAFAIQLLNVQKKFSYSFSVFWYLTSRNELENAVNKQNLFETAQKWNRLTQSIYLISEKLNTISIMCVGIEIGKITKKVKLISLASTLKRLI